MKFNVNSENLSKGLKSAVKAIPGKALTPIMESFKLEVSGSRLTITATNGEITVKAPVVLTEKAAEEGIVTVPAKRLLDFVNLLPSCPVDISTKDGTMSIKWTKGSTKMQLTDHSMFPEISEPKNSPMMNIPAQELLTALSATIPVAAKDNARPILTGIHFDIRNDSTRVVATDTKMLTYGTLPCGTDTDTGITIPAQAASLLKTAVHKNSTVARLTFDENCACFNFGDIIVMTRLLNGSYPKYMTIIPQADDIKGQVLTSKESIIGSLRRLASCSARLKMKLSPLAITFTAQNTDTGTSAVEDCDCTYCGDEMEMGINPTNMISILETISGETISLEVTSSRKPILAKPADTSLAESLSLCMPVVMS